MTSILTPVLALVAWSLVVWFFMYVTRIPAMQKSGIDPQDARFPGSLNVLPDAARQVADNYNHLMEQPTIFYALIFYLHLSSQADPINVQLAWAYVCLRIVHSLIQVTINRVALRFLVFAISSLVLVALCVRAALALFA